MTTNQTIDGVPRELLEKALIDAMGSRARHSPHIAQLRALLDAKPETVAGHHPACRAVDEYKPGECSHSCKTPSDAACPGDGVGPCKKCPDAQPQGDTVAVSARWSDWSMVTLEIDGQHRTYVEACKPKQSRGEPVAPDSFWQWLDSAYRDGSKGEKPRFTKYNMEVAYSAGASAETPKGEPVGFRYRAQGEPWELMDESPFADGRTHYRENGEELEPVYTEQPAPVAVALERSPEDYAVEHAEYMAKSADDVLAKFQAYGLALLAVDEGGDDGEGELFENFDSARGDLQEALGGLRDMVYEFRKRAAKSR